MRSWDFPKTNLEAVALFKCSNTHLVEMLASFATPFDEYGKKSYSSNATDGLIFKIHELIMRMERTAKVCAKQERRPH